MGEQGQMGWNKKGNLGAVRDPSVRMRSRSQFLHFIVGNLASVLFSLSLSLRAAIPILSSHVFFSFLGGMIYARAGVYSLSVRA